MKDKSLPVLTLMPQAFKVSFLCTNVLTIDLFCFASLDTLEQIEQPSYDEKSHYEKKEDRAVFLACADFNAPGIRVPFLQGVSH